MLDVAISLPRFLFQGIVSLKSKHGYDTKNQAESQWGERGEFDAMRHKRTICRAKTAYSTRHFCLDYTNAAMGWRRDAARQRRKRITAAQAGRTNRVRQAERTREPSGCDAGCHAHVRGWGAALRVFGATLRVGDATRRVGDATCRERGRFTAMCVARLPGRGT